ncbi:hypothetical protein Fleli_3452 [Bernardetia litoralis DSM 6794]|uniref:Leucine Rich Repeat (LRR)-containing protein n=1 Tax=Bernardetia litoralis (strain ATCC 23117 / DSM 6794 / NBRC 15988 / NCIMB 1366 / Fx l1 / Sio-4) TaxID=880071 RepID=I4AP87_BERLS|nr:leucine-rich repeat domain-containing protein [Bernardetia litoralis]AFM05772.1 hypothetical protein Fleli_3452 [Bernardetia litoralis DSM 6794]
MGRTRISINDYTLFKDEISFLSDKTTMTKERILWENSNPKFRGVLLIAIKKHIKKIKSESLSKNQKVVKEIKLNDKLEDKEINLIFQFLKEIETIDLRDTAIESLEILAFFEKIEVLSISENPIITLDGIESLKKLRKLFCINTEIETVENLKNCKNLQELYCAKNQIKSLESLSKNEKLILINCRKTLITKKEVGKFLKSKPNCNVIRKGFLF